MSCSGGCSRSSPSLSYPGYIANSMSDDLFEANTSRKFAAKELLLLERHHLGTADARCMDDCEPSHLLAASAALTEAARLSGGSEEDKILAQRLESINLNNPDAKEVQQQVRQIRKPIMHEVVSGNGYSSLGYYDKKSLVTNAPPSEKKPCQFVKFAGIVGGGILIGEGIYSLTNNKDKSSSKQAFRIIRILAGATLLIASLRS